jgi:hypothetical protein
MGQVTEAAEGTPNWNEQLRNAFSVVQKDVKTQVYPTVTFSLYSS